MKKLFILMSFLLTASLFGQSWINTLKEPTGNNFYDIQKSFNDYWKDKDHTQKGKGWKPFKRWEWFWEQRVYPEGSFPDQSQLFSETQKLHNRIEKSQNSFTGNWTTAGPSQSNGGYAGLGRINCVRTNPLNSNQIYIGAASGGLWTSTDAGATWVTNTDNLPSMGVTDLVINPSFPDTMFMATGDGDHGDTYSIGVLKSIDGGTTWNTTGLSWQTSSKKQISRLAMHPNNPSMIFAGGSFGIYFSTNSGTTWTLASGLSKWVSGIEFNPTDPTIMYASTTGGLFYRSTNTGASWTQITTGLPSTGIARAVIAVTPANTSYVYMLISNTSSGFYGFYKSSDAGLSFSQQTLTPNILGYNQDGSDAGGQAWYDLCLAVSPFNADEIYTGGINLWKSTNGGVNWTAVSSWTSTVHADQHDLYFVPGANILYNGNDGGVYKSTNSGTSWTWLGKGLEITQIYKIGVSQSNPNYTIMGCQDNGTKLVKNGAWSDVLGGDGMECIIDYSNSNIMYGEIYYGDLRKSTNAGSTWTSIKSNITESGAWVTPFVIHPSNPQTLYIGYNNLWQTTNGGSAWTKLTSFVDATDISVVQISQSDPNYIYFIKNNINYKTTDGGTTWNTYPSPATGTTTAIAIDPQNPLNIYETISGYTAGKHAYKSTDGGSTWSNISGSLPNVPANTIIFQNNTNERLFVGTDIGVFTKDAAAGDWSAFNSNLPNVVIDELEIQYSSSKLRAATFGRGLWESDLPPSIPDVPVLSLPANLAVSQPVSLSLVWNASANASTYRVELASDSLFTNIVLNDSTVSSTSRSVAGLLNNTKYYWRVNASNSSGTSIFSTVWSFTTLQVTPPPVPAVPVLISPSNNAVSQPSALTLVWGAVSGALSYKVQLSSDSLFSTLILNDSTVTSGNRAVTGLSFSAKYYWRVNASNASGASAYSSVWNFSTTVGTQGPPVPVATWPVNNAVVFANNPKLEWYLPGSYTGAVTYDIKIFDNSDPNNAVLSADNISAENYQVTSALLGGHSYSWVIQSHGALGVSGYSASALFRIDNSIGGTPPVPIPTWPVANTTIFETTPDLGWFTSSPFEGALTFDVVVTDLATGLPVYTVNGLASANQNVPSGILLGGHSYTWQVQSHFNGTASGYSSLASFNIFSDQGGVPPVPVPCWPSNNSSIYTSTPVLEWYLGGAYSGTVSYDIELFDVSAPAAVVFDTTVSGNSTFVTVTLLAGHSYQWHVRSTGSAVHSDYSAYALFSIDNSLGGVPPKPVQTWPINNASIFVTTPKMEWYLGGNYGGPVTYDISVFNNTDLVNPVYSAPDISTEYTTLTTPLLPGNSYSWEVQTHAGSLASGYSSFASFNTDGIQYGNPKPYIAWPLGGATIFDLKPLLEWYILGTPTGTVTYEIELKAASDLFDGTNTIVTSNSAQSFQFPAALTSGQSYHWRVRLLSTAAVPSGWSDEILTGGAQFSLAASASEVAVPMAGSPVNGVYVPSGAVCLSWYITTAPVANQTYKLEISKSPDLSSPVGTYDNLASMNKVINSLDNGTYYWRVTAKSVDGKSTGYSDKGNFHVGSTTGITNEESIIPKVFEVFQNYPNPFNPSTQIKYGLPKASDVTIKVYNMLGQEIKTLVSEHKNAGTFTVRWNGDNNNGSKVSSGIYIFRVSAGSNSSTMKMILIK